MHSYISDNKIEQQIIERFGHFTYVLWLSKISY